MNTQSDKDAEYQFSEGQTSDVYGSSSRGSATQQGLQRRKVLMVIVSVIIIFSVYQAIHSFFFSSKKESTQKVETMQTHPKVTTPVQTTTASTTSDDSAVSQQISTIQSQSSSTKNRIDNLESTVSKLSDSVTNLENRIYIVNSSVEGMSDKLSTQSTQLADLIKIQMAKAAPKTAAKKPEIPVYYVQAVLPGRAWIVTPQGNTLTLVVGDTLPSYGKITKINPRSGDVKTSGGKTIRFKPDRL